MIVGSGTVATAAFAGCLGRAQEDSGDEPADGSSRSIIVSESGRAEAEPDLAILHVGVVETGDDAATVRDGLATRSTELKEALLDYGIPEDDVSTTRYDIRERVDRRRMEEEGTDPSSPEAVEEYTYYEGTYTFRVEVHDVDQAGEVVDVAVDTGADDVGRIEFTLSDERREELREEALEEAIENARTEANFVAEQVDASVVEVTLIDSSGGQVSPVHERVALDAAATPEPATEFQPDDVTVTASVRVEYEME